MLQLFGARLREKGCIVFSCSVTIPGLLKAISFTLGSQMFYCQGWNHFDWPSGLAPRDWPLGIVPSRIVPSSHHQATFDRRHTAHFRHLSVSFG